MGINRLRDSKSKPGMLRWLQTVSMPRMGVDKLTTSTCYATRTRRWATRRQSTTAWPLLPLIDEDLSVVFYDLTTFRGAGLNQKDGDLRRPGISKEGVIARQFMLGVVQTTEGMPMFGEILAGNTAKAPTLEPTLNKVSARFHIREPVASPAWSLRSSAASKRLSTTRRSRLPAPATPSSSPKYADRYMAQVQFILSVRWNMIVMLGYLIRALAKTPIRHERKIRLVEFRR
jgi:hypothetical protein